VLLVKRPVTATSAARAAIPVETLVAMPVQSVRSAIQIEAAHATAAAHAAATRWTITMGRAAVRCASTRARTAARHHTWLDDGRLVPRHIAI
jgi:hypothetical protein